MFYFILFFFLHNSGGAKAPLAPPSARSLRYLVKVNSSRFFVQSVQLTMSIIDMHGGENLYCLGSACKEMPVWHMSAIKSGP